ncbi:PREDICTED: caspase-1-like, partial [Tauraco erythrolophus]|uniref:caspase-1-like n=1 Tax=Tauraco erythrolophus TaxID=121530 RepID=UPI0005235604
RVPFSAEGMQTGLVNPWADEDAAAQGGVSLPAPGQGRLEGDANCEVHLESDFATFHSSMPDAVSWRSSVTGSLFIQGLIEQFQNHACNSDLQEIFQKVQYSFGKFLWQLPSQEQATMLRKFCLFPGHSSPAHGEKIIHGQQKCLNFGIMQQEAQA